MTPHSEQSAPINVPVLVYKSSSANNHRENLLMLDDPGLIRCHIACVVCQIQRFDFDCNLVLTRTVIIWIPPALDLNLYIDIHLCSCTAGRCTPRTSTAVRMSGGSTRCVRGVNAPPPRIRAIRPTYAITYIPFRSLAVSLLKNHDAYLQAKETWT